MPKSTKVLRRSPSNSHDAPSSIMKSAAGGMMTRGGNGGGSSGGFMYLLSFLVGVAVTSLSYQRSELGLSSSISAIDAQIRADSVSSSSSSTLSSPVISSSTTVSTIPLNDVSGSGSNERALVGGSTTTTAAAAATTDIAGSTTTKVVTTKDFQQIGSKTGTDKVDGPNRLPGCLQTGQCIRKDCERKECRPWGHWYHTMYKQWIADYALPTAEPFQFLEIGFFHGKGFETYSQYFADAPHAELHSMEISCLPEGPRSEGKWPKEWGNTASKSPRYQELLDNQRLHCGDASDIQWLNQIWTTKMRRGPDAPPLRIVVDDASHLSSHMVKSIFFWFPRIEPGGLLIVEDIQPIHEANLFRTQFMPQIMSDLHYCGDPNQPKDEACFPQLWPLLQSIHCEMHICVLERNQQPSKPNLSLEESSPPSNALDLKQCYSFANVFGSTAS